MPSTAIASIDYDIASRVLKITFVSGTVYAYFDVPDDVYINFMKARSKGRFLNTYVKGAYGFKKL